MKTIRVGVIGTGKHGSRYANHVAHDVEGLGLAAVCKRSGDVVTQAAQWGCTPYRDWRALVGDPEVEAVILALPPMLNLEVVREAVAAGKPLLVEKPLAGTVADAEQIVSLCREKKVPLTTGQTLRYNQVVQRLKKELPSIGTLRSFTANQRLEPITLAWHRSPELAGAGVSFHTAVHVIDAVAFITGMQVQRVMALARHHHGEALEDLLAVLIEMENGVVGTLDCSKVGSARSGRFEFVGSQGQLDGEQIHNQLYRIEGTEKVALDTGSAVPTIVPLLQEWLSFLRGSGPNPVTGEDGLAAVRFCGACLESAANNQWVEMNSSHQY
jgi:predicted dehydrogenase